MSRSASCSTTATPLIPAMLAGGFRLRDGAAPRCRLARARGRPRGSAGSDDGWLAVGPPLSIPDKGARIVAAPGGERIAVFRDGAQIGALTNLCAHQNGPIGGGPHHRRLRHLSRGTAISIGWRMAARRRRSPRSSRPIACASRAAWSRSTRDPLPPGTPAAMPNVGSDVDTLARARSRSFTLRAVLRARALEEGSRK